jgi:DNA phosphorothioation-associated DGQHR protein 1
MVTFPIETKAILVRQPLYEFYVAALPAEALLRVAFSDAMQASLNPDGIGYTVDATQRVMQSKRLSQIAKYIDREDSAFPNSIILAANFRPDGLIEDDEPQEVVNDDLGVSSAPSKRWTLVPDACGGFTLTIPTEEKLAAVIDGQHRLFAFAESSRRDRLEMSLLCSIYLDLPKPYQAQLFATINSTQKPVDKSLTYELFGYNIDEEEPEYWSPDKLAVFLTRKLGTESASPLRGRIAIAPKKDAALERIQSNQDWKVSTAVIVEGIMRLYSSNPKRDTQLMLTPSRNTRRALANGPKDRSPMRQAFIETNDNLIYTTVYNYLLACQDVFWSNASRSSFITRTVGVQALFDLLRKVLIPAALLRKNVSKDFFHGHLSAAAGIDFATDRFADASGSGRSKIRKALEEAIGNIS